ncbi:GerMN domain-containing protein [Clostridium sp. P21]|uniref:GerMN domain-containing protein n=1 Tax=Clostridium muellerianum TaxID=2716538 RepID=A0A7Y0EER2_9CLOT|nr:GerMN domain-containing protein [Clostridium muellerianum]NMM62120.1 GerMN domain-containing protein [Clostridium muellerianum]
MKKTFCIFVCSITIFSTISLTGCKNKDIANTKDKEKQIALSKEKENTLDINVYFGSSNNTTELSKEERVIKKDELLGEAIINELIKGPSVKSNLNFVLPKETKLLSFSIKDNTAYVNFSKEANVSMKSSKEEVCLKSIIFSLSEISSIQKVKILIDNKDTNLWGDNFDLSKPLEKNTILNAKKK